jgi:hypothetical protein
MLMSEIGVVFYVSSCSMERAILRSFIELLFSQDGIERAISRLAALEEKQR